MEFMTRIDVHNVYSVDQFKETIVFCSLLLTIYTVAMSDNGPFKLAVLEKPAISVRTVYIQTFSLSSLILLQKLVR